MILPLSNNPSETFSFIIDGQVYKFKQVWNTSGFWTLSIADINEDTLVDGIVLVTQTNLLNMHPSISFDLRSERDNDPTRNNLDQFELQILEK